MMSVRGTLLCALPFLMNACLYSDLNTPNESRLYGSGSQNNAGRGFLDSDNGGDGPGLASGYDGGPSRGSSGGGGPGGSGDPTNTPTVGQDTDGDGDIDTYVPNPDYDPQRNLGTVKDISLDEFTSFGGIIYSGGDNDGGFAKNPNASGQAVRLTASIKLAGKYSIVQSLRVYRIRLGENRIDPSFEPNSCDLPSSQAVFTQRANNANKTLTLNQADGIEDDGSLKPAAQRLTLNRYYVYQFCYYDANQRLVEKHNEAIYSIDSAPPVASGAAATARRVSCSGGKSNMRINLRLNRPDPSLTNVIIRYGIDLRDDGDGLEFANSINGGQFNIANADTRTPSLADKALGQLATTGLATYEFQIPASGRNSNRETATGENTRENKGLRFAYELEFQNDTYKKSSLEEIYGPNAPGILISLPLDLVKKSEPVSVDSIGKNTSRFLRGYITFKRCGDDR